MPGYDWLWRAVLQGFSRRCLVTSGFGLSLGHRQAASSVGRLAWSYGTSVFPTWLLGCGVILMLNQGAAPAPVTNIKKSASARSAHVSISRTSNQRHKAPQAVDENSNPLSTLDSLCSSPPTDASPTEPHPCVTSHSQTAFDQNRQACAALPDCLFNYRKIPHAHLSRKDFRH